MFNEYNGVFANAIYTNDKFDIAMILHVLEHFHRPKEFMDHVVNQVKDGGYVYIEVPHLHYFTNWEDSIYLEHMNNFTEKTLNQINDANYEVILAITTESVVAADTSGAKVIDVP